MRRQSRHGSNSQAKCKPALHSHSGSFWVTFCTRCRNLGFALPDGQMTTWVPKPRTTWKERLLNIHSSSSVLAKTASFNTWQVLALESRPFWTDIVSTSKVLGNIAIKVWTFGKNWLWCQSHPSIMWIQCKEGNQVVSGNYLIFLFISFLINLASIILD